MFMIQLSNGSKVDHVACLLTPVNDVLLSDLGGVIGRMSGHQDTDTSRWFYILSNDEAIRRGQLCRWS
eukprot:scaffold2883_cov102-Skeletonema_dohrnii-CCMP3373.AAC.2